MEMHNSLGRWFSGLTITVYASEVLLLTHITWGSEYIVGIETMVLSGNARFFGPSVFRVNVVHASEVLL